MKYDSCLFISSKDKQEIEDLLSINDINTEHKGQTFDFIQIGSYTYENGITLYVDLCSGETNYFLQYELVDTDYNVVDSDTFDKLKDFDIFSLNDIYGVHFDFYEEEYLNNDDEYYETCGFNKDIELTKLHT